MRVFVLAALLALLQAASCKRESGDCPAGFLDKGDDRMTVVNQSNATVFMAFSNQYPADAQTLNLLVPTIAAVNANEDLNFGANSTKKYKAPGCWDARFGNIPSGKLRILLFEVENIKNHTADEIISQGLYKSYLYTLDELKALDWKIIYP